MMELTWLDDFLALAQTRNMTRAAVLRFTTQPALTRRLQNLEHWLGADLFDRQTRPLQLTPAGEAFFVRAHNLRTDILDAQRLTRNFASNYHHQCRIYTTNTIAIGLLPKLLQDQSITNPTLVVASVQGCLEAVRQGQAAFAFVPQLPATPHSNVTTEYVATDALQLYPSLTTHCTLQRKAGVISGKIMQYTPGSFFGALLTQHLQDKGWKIVSMLATESASAEALKAFHGSDMGAAWLPKSLCGHLKPAWLQDFSVTYDIVRISAL